jgi:uncharacterized protein (DUF736 family)
MDMAIIGNFRMKDGRWSGTIRTLTIDVRAEFVPVTDRAEGAPDFRVVAGGAELGAAWCEESRDGETPYLAVRLDDPALPAPLRAAFFENDDGASGILVWSRTKAP